MKKILTKIMSVLLVAMSLQACGTKTEPTEPTSPSPTPDVVEPTPEIVEEGTEIKEPEQVMYNRENYDFENALIKFLDTNGYEKENYMVSPTSFRAALALAVSGADTETKEQLLKAMNFKDMDEVLTWYKSVLYASDLFKQEVNEQYEYAKSYADADENIETIKERDFLIQNSIWRNTKSQGNLSGEYINFVKENFRAESQNVSPEEITNSVNDWVNKNTKGLIPSIADDLSDNDMVLANALYLRTVWENEFNENATETGDFTTIDKETVQKDFMQKQDKIRYYEDERGKFIILPMENGINAVFALGDIENLMSKLEMAESTEVIVKLPKFDVETSLSNHELVEFCKAQGADLAFSKENADFSKMCGQKGLLYIDDIIQKSKIKTDEEGIEAAAVTVILMKANAMMPEPEEPKEFIANEPFRFLLLTDTESPEVLFYGQIVK